MLLAAACGRPPEPRLRDLVTNAALTSSRAPVVIKRNLCADETHYSIVMRPGEVVTTDVALDRKARLLISGCLEEDAVQNGLPRLPTLDVTMTSEYDSEAVRLPAQTGSGWWRQEIDLAQLRRGPARLRLKARLPARARLFVRDLVVTDEVAASRQSAPAPLQILLISVDTLRWDGLSALGGPWPTPRLDRFLEQCQVWTNHYAADCWTQPSHAGLLTGQLPEAHGCIGTKARLRPEVATLAEHLHRAGFLTEALVDEVGWLAPKYGFGRGFDTYRVVPWQLRHQVVETARWIAEHRNQPFFYFLHTFVVHSDAKVLPYEGPRTTRRTVARLFGVPSYGCRNNLCASELLIALNEQQMEPIPGEEEILHHLYGRGIAALDEQLGWMLEHLGRRGVLDNLLVVLTSDHGESFMEHGHEVAHGNYWQENVRAPLAIKWPGGGLAGQTQQTTVSALDVVPTVLAAAGLNDPNLPGRDLARRADRVPVFSGSDGRVIIYDGYKGIAERRPKRFRLYHLASDPGETTDLAAEHPDRARQLQRLLAQARARARATRSAAAVPEVQTSDDEKERLRALGYVVD